MRRLERLPLKPLAVALALATPQLVYGQLEEIVVTAERREASELTTAISVEVFTQEQLSLDKLQTVEDLQYMTPNLTINNQGFTIQSVNIRGVGNAVGNPNIQPGVVVMKDGMIAGETVVIQQGFLDLGTIEVLRGPQGTFVGQASTGGAVVINSARPNFDGVNGWLETRFGDYADTMFQGAVNLPLSDKISTRFAFRTETRDGFFENNLVNEQGVDTFWQTGVHPGNVDSQNARASILWEPNDSFSVLARAEFNTIRTDADAPFIPNPRRYRNPLDPTGFGQAQYYAFSESVLSGSTDERTLAYNNRDNHMESTTNLFSLEVSKTFDNGVTFVSKTGYQDNDLRTSEDRDATRANGNHWRIDVGPDNDYYNQEFNLLSPDGNRLSWLVGTAWYHRFTPVQLSVDLWPCGYNGATGVVDPCTLDDRRAAQRTMVDNYTIQRHAGLFGQVTYDISDTWELEVGARYSWDNNDNFTEVHVAFDTLAPTVPPPFAGNPFPCSNPVFQRVVPQNRDEYACINPVTRAASFASFEEEEPTWKVGLNWTPGDEHFIYMFYSRGYKSGGVDGGARFENEVVDDYEFGYKGTLADGKVQLSAGVFYMDYQSMQQEAFLILTEPGTTSDSEGIRNIGDSTIQGIEFDLNSQFGNLGFNFGMGFVDSDLGGITNIDSRQLDPTFANIGGTPGGAFRRGCRPGEAPGLGADDCFDYAASAAFLDLAAADNLYSPELQWNMAIDYQFPLANGATVRPRLAAMHSDSSWSSLFQSDDYFLNDEYDMVNFSIAYETDAWAATFYCNNCTEETYIASAVADTPSLAIYSNPRTVGVRFRYDF
jgi:iron complex outermembrane receptor protein